MRTKGSSKFIIIFIITCFLVGVFFISNAHADWYLSKVTRVIPRADGDCFVQFTSVDGKWSGVARGLIDGSDSGAKQLLATFLTALSLGYNVSIEMSQTPSFNPIGVITGAGVSAPQKLNSNKGHQVARILLNHALGLEVQALYSLVQRHFDIEGENKPFKRINTAHPEKIDDFVAFGLAEQRTSGHDDVSDSQAT